MPARASNAAIAQAELDALLPGQRGFAEAAGALLDLGRSLLRSERRQKAVDAVETVRDLS
jgi:hypothetical protein